VDPKRYPGGPVNPGKIRAAGCPLQTTACGSNVILPEYRDACWPSFRVQETQYNSLWDKYQVLISHQTIIPELVGRLMVGEVIPESNLFPRQTINPGLAGGQMVRRVTPETNSTSGRRTLKSFPLPFGLLFIY